MDGFKKVFTNSNIQLAITLGGVAMVLILFIITSQLAPLVQDIALLKQADAQTIKTMDNGFSQVNASLIRIENKVDNICK